MGEKKKKKKKGTKFPWNFKTTGSAEGAAHLALRL